MPIVFLLVFLGGLLSGIDAAEKGLEITRVMNTTIELEPPCTFTTAFRVVNNTGQKQELISLLQLSPGWRLLTGELPFVLEAHESTIRLVSIFVPRRTPAGQYDVTYTVRVKDAISWESSHHIPVTVLPIRAFNVKALKFPESVIAGEEYQAVYAVINKSNIDISVNITTKCDNELPVTLSENTVKILPGESHDIVVTAKTDPRSSQVHRQRLTFIAQLGEDTTIQARELTSVKIIPQVTGSDEKYYAIPTTMRLRHITIDNIEEKASLFQVEITGQGTIDENEEKNIAFFLRGPDVKARTYSEIRDEYYLRYWTENMEFHLGDDTYSLSTLTDNNAGRGARVKFKIREFNIAAYYCKNIWITNPAERFAGIVGYTIGDRYSVNVNFFNKHRRSSNDIIFSLLANMKLSHMFNLEIEYARGRRNQEKGLKYDDDAFLVGVLGDYLGISYSLKYVLAGKNFPGYFKSTDFLMASMAAPINHNVSFKTSYQQGKDYINPEFTPEFGPEASFVPTSINKNYQAGLEYKFEARQSMYLMYKSSVKKENRIQSTSFEHPVLEYEEDVIRIGTGHTYPKFVINSAFEYGTQWDITKKEAQIKRYSLSSSFNPGSNYVFSGFLWYGNDYGFSGDMENYLIAGIKSSLEISPSTSLYLSYQLTDYPERNDPDRHRISFNITYSFANNHALSMDSRHSTMNGSENILLIDYSLPFDLPVARKKNKGSIRGYVYDEETGKPLSNIIFSLDGAMAVSDASGFFTFPSIRPGVYHLDINLTRIGFDRITTRKCPVEVTVEPGKELFEKIGVTRSATVSGQVMLYEFGENHGQGGQESQSSGSNGSFVVSENQSGNLLPRKEPDLVKAGGFGSAIVELRTDNNIQRRVTDNNGNFRFEDVRPGEWTLKVYDYNLPDYHYLEQEKIELELQPGEQENIFVRIVPRKRHIRILIDGGTLTNKE